MYALMVLCLLRHRSCDVVECEQTLPYWCIRTLNIKRESRASRANVENASLNVSHVHHVQMLKTRLERESRVSRANVENAS